MGAQEEQGLGDALTAAMAPTITPDPGQLIGATKVNALVLLTRDAASWAAMESVFGAA